ncbi:NAD-dependent protein deacetylase Sirt2 [Zeugodacus cucurbitae]|uniref:NAD-dependent protein deacetylase n=1 Tax=Zeugodacus cucurbitae TaxID=28588 RepID=A0A0A1X192_ZEUCU|nr:NAD-dependent protein deacetylase Sirt2 [Zeugodacus cucurbitae]
MSNRGEAGPSRNPNEEHHQPRTANTRDEDIAPSPSSVLESIRTNITNLFSRLSVHQHEHDTVIPNLTFEGFLKHWKDNGFKKIITLVGAGISTSAGIPDFRTPGTGLYDNLKKYDLPHPTDIFELDYFLENPKPFFSLAKELYPGNFIPTPTHYFIRLLNDKGLLVRHYTQNIDSLERIAGIPEDKMVEAHGTFHTNHCLECTTLYSKEWMKEKIFSDTIPLCDHCAGIVKPDIVFFGENMPDSFYNMPTEDFKDCDLLFVMGTSLEVYPFASLVGYAEPTCLRVLINRTSVNKFTSPVNKRNITYVGDCDDAVWKITDALGWTAELKALIKKETGQFEKPKTRSVSGKSDAEKKHREKKS